MKKFCIGILCIILIEQVQAQLVKKISVGELEQFIADSKTPLVINFWATFCKPCIDEIPYFLAAAEAKGDSMELVLVSLDLPEYFPKKVESFLLARQFTGPTQFWMNETNADSFCPRIDTSWEGTMPVTLFVNNKKIYRRFVNRPMTELQVKEAFNELIR
jgi:thiol-disulfide isomerase/thioredoxin